MARPIPKPDDVFLHFKGKKYKVLHLAHHSETDETLVVYQALYGDGKICARPIDMFLSEVDHVKYPDVQQKWRFQLISENGYYLPLNKVFRRVRELSNIPLKDMASRMNVPVVQLSDLERGLLEPTMEQYDFMLNFVMSGTLSTTEID